RLRKLCLNINCFTAFVDQVDSDGCTCNSHGSAPLGGRINAFAELFANFFQRLFCVLGCIIKMPCVACENKSNDAHLSTFSLDSKYRRFRRSITCVFSAINSPILISYIAHHSCGDIFQNSLGANSQPPRSLIPQAILNMSIIWMSWPSSLAPFFLRMQERF